MDWTRSMEQTFEYYVVDPVSWLNKRQLKTVRQCSLKFDISSDLLASASLEIDEALDECYVRVYLVATQDYITEKFALGTFLVQTPSMEFSGASAKHSIDAYSPLIELQDKKVPIGYYVEKEKFNILEQAGLLADDHCRAPVVVTKGLNNLQTNFTAKTDDNWLSYLKDLVTSENYEFSLDEMGRILFSPTLDARSMQPIWTFNDDNSSILYPTISLSHDLYKVPNVVEVLYTGSNNWVFSRVENNNPNSPISLVNRGREVTYREENPVIIENPVQGQIDVYANDLLRKLSDLEYTLSYTHGYCPVQAGDCIRLNYERAGIKDVKARVKSQTIKCVPGCPVTETATFTTNLWKELYQ